AAEVAGALTVAEGEAQVGGAEQLADPGPVQAEAADDQEGAGGVRPQRLLPLGVAEVEREEGRVREVPPRELAGQVDDRLLVAAARGVHAPEHDRRLPERCPQPVRQGARAGCDRRPRPVACPFYREWQSQ